MATVAAMALALSCGGMEEGSPAGLDEGGSAPMTLSLDLRARTLEEIPGYGQGSAWENCIDIAGGDYRIYFFTNEAPDGDDRLIARFEPEGFVEKGRAGGNGRWTVRGRIPDVMLGHSDFKVLVLANLGGAYDDAGLVTVEEDAAGATTISGILGAEWSRFPAKEDFELGSGNLIPLFGVQEFSGVELSAETMTVLPSPVCLLRAMAKVEVTIGTEDVAVSSVRVCRYNSAGYCAPQNVYDGSYVTDQLDFSWSLEGLHLVGGSNEDQTDREEDDRIRRLTMLRVTSGNSAGNSMEKSPDGSTGNSAGGPDFGKSDGRSAGNSETWVAYLPEYDNGGDDYSFIEIVPQKGTPQRVYFALYSGGTTTAYDPDGDRGSRLDILRNSLYRFSVTFTGSLFSVRIDGWDAEHDNDFEFSPADTTDRELKRDE